MGAGRFFGGNVSRRSERVDGVIATAVVAGAVLFSGFTVASANDGSTPAPAVTSVVEAPTETVTIGGSAGYTVSGSAGLTK